MADVVAEWAHRHQQPFLLDHTGVTGGRYAAEVAYLEPNTVLVLPRRRGSSARPLAGRSPASGLLATIVRF
jgi:hypothetical protein